MKETTGIIENERVRRWVLYRMNEWDNVYNTEWDECDNGYYTEWMKETMCIIQNAEICIMNETIQNEWMRQYVLYRMNIRDNMLLYRMNERWQWGIIQNEWMRQWVLWMRQHDKWMSIIHNEWMRQCV